MTSRRPARMVFWRSAGEEKSADDLATGMVAKIGRS
jgi:hypothetical protein